MDEQNNPVYQDVSGIDKEAMLARRMAKPGSGKGGGIKAADYFALINESQVDPSISAEMFSQAFLSALKEMNLKEDTPEYGAFVKDYRDALRQDVVRGADTPKAIIEGAKLVITQLNKLVEQTKKQDSVGRTEKIVTRVEKLTAEQKKNKELERQEKLVKKEEDLQKKANEHQKKAEELIVKREKIMGVDERQFKLRGKLVDMERKQRELYNRDIAKGDIQSKVMHEKSSKALERISRIDKEAVDQQDKYDRDMMELQMKILDTLKAMGQAPLSERREYQKHLTGLLGTGKAIANDPDRGPARRAFGLHMQQYEKAIEPQMRGPGVMAQLGDWGKTAVKQTAREMWERKVPMPLRIIAEGAFHGLRGAFGNTKKEIYAKAQYAYEQDKINATREKVLAGASDTVSLDGEQITLRHRGRSRERPDRIVARGDGKASVGSRIAPRGGDMKELRVDKLVADKLEILNQDAAEAKPVMKEKEGESLADRVGKEANTLRKGKGFDLGGLFKGFLGKLGAIFAGVGTMFMGVIGKLAMAMGPLVGILAKALPLLGAAGAVAAAGAAGYAVGTMINKGANWLAEKITGREGETAQSAIVGAVDKLQDKAGGYLGKSSSMVQKEGEVAASTKRFGELLKLQGGEMTSKQIAFWRGQGVDVSAAKVNENVTVLGPDNKPIQPRKMMESTELVPDMIPKNQLMPDQSPAEAARMASGGKNSALAAPTAAITARTDMVDAASRQLEASKEVRTAKPNVVVNNIGGGGGQDKMQPPPISIGAARNQENAFARYLASNFAAL